MFKAKEFLTDHQIPHWDSGGVNGIRRDKRCVNSHYQLPCKKCGSNGNLIGIRKSNSRINCYSCGSISTVEFIKLQLEISWTQAKQLATSYSSTAVEEVEASEKQSTLKKIAETCTLPPHKELSNRAKKYLRGRGLDPQILIDEYRVVEGKGGEYDRRIIFPIYLGGKLVSYQGMSYIEDKGKRYKACSADKEVFKHQDITYGLSESKYDIFIVCEGLADCHSLNSVEVGVAGCTFGVDWSTHQMRMLRESGKKVYLMYDSEPKARKRAEGLCSALAVHGVEIENLSLGDGLDPNDLSFEEIDEILEFLNI